MATLATPLQRAVLTAGSRTAVTCGDTRLTYAQLSERVRRIGGGLRRLGLRPGDRVAVLGANCHRYLELYLGVPVAGFVVVPLNPRHTVDELRYELGDSGARALFDGTGRPELDGTVEHVCDLGEQYEALLVGADSIDPTADLAEDELAGLFYTGGTTGAAKGVMLTHRNLVANAMHFSMCWPFTPDTRWLVIAPMFHAAGSIGVLATVWNGGQHVMLPAFDAAAALDAIEHHRITATLVVPTMLAALSDEQLARPRDVSSLGYFSHGGSPCATETLRRAHAAFPAAQLLHIYGATETSPIATLMPGEELLLETPRARSCGQPAVGVEVVVVADGDDERHASGRVGEIAVRGPNVMVGYWNKPVETAEALVDGWYRTGDLGYQDDEGFVFLVDRSKDMIVTGGENVYSTEVEDALYRHPAVLEAAVFGVPDAKWGEAVHAVVVPRTTVEPRQLVAHCRAVLADYKVPKVVELRSEPLPKSAAGKVLKRELREPYWKGAATRVGGA